MLCHINDIYVHFIFFRFLNKHAPSIIPVALCRPNAISVNRLAQKHSDESLRVVEVQLF